MEPGRSAAGMPSGIANAYAFSVFNALSFQMVLGGPMVLYAKSLGASATVLGLVTGLMPIMTVAQLPAARFIPRVGYKRFVVGGWTTRVMFIVGMAMVPGATWLNEGSRLALVMALLFAFNLSRGISSCAWLPWITQWVPATVRGRYLTVDQAFVNGASATAFVLAAVLLGPSAGPWRYALVFGFSAAAGFASLVFLRRMPDVPVPPEEGGGKGEVPWGALAAHPPFRRLLELNVAWSLAFGGLTTFIVSFLKSGGGMGERAVLMVMSLSFAGGLASYAVAAGRMERVGSKPVLGLTMALGMASTLGWMLVAGGVMGGGAWWPCLLAFVVGLCNALFSVANNRLAMVIVPAMGRNHFFAIFAVVWQLTLGMSPVLWGILLDAMGERSGAWLGVGWNRYSVFFGLAAAAFGWAFHLARRLEEPKAGTADALLRELLVQNPQRWLVRLFGR